MWQDTYLRLLLFPQTTEPIGEPRKERELTKDTEGVEIPSEAPPPDGGSWMSFLYRQDEAKRMKTLRRSWWD